MSQIDTSRSQYTSAKCDTYGKLWKTLRMRDPGDLWANEKDNARSVFIMAQITRLRLSYIGIPADASCSLSIEVLVFLSRKRRRLAYGFRMFVLESLRTEREREAEQRGKTGEK